MVYYKDYRLTILETDGKYTLYDAKYSGRAVHQNKSKEWTDDYIQRVLSKRKGRTKQIADKKNQEMVDCINRALEFKNHGEQYSNTPIPFCSLHTKISGDDVKTHELHFSGLADWDYEMNIRLERMDYDYVMNALKINLVIFMEKWTKHLIETELKED